MNKFLALGKHWDHARLQARSRCLTWKLRLMGLEIGNDVEFAGPVLLRINGDPGKIRIGDRVKFGGKVDLRNRENGAIRIEEDCFFDDNARFVAAREATIRIGRGTAVGKDLVINAGADVTIGENCLFSSYINIHSSTHRCLKGQSVYSQGYVQEPVVIGNDVWLASNVNVLFGTRVGNGVISAPNSVLAGTYPPDSILIGTPAVMVSERSAELSPLKEMTDIRRYVSALVEKDLSLVRERPRA